MSAYLQSRDPTAVMGRRIGAFLVDGVIGAAVAAVVFFAMAEEVPSFTVDSLDSAVNAQITLNDTAYVLEGGDAGLFYAITFGFGFLIHVVLQGLTGATPGKAIFGVRCVNREGQACGVGRALIRWVVWIVDAFPWFLPLVGFITALASKGHRRVGDMAASTFVVGTGDVGRAVSVPGLTSAAGPYGAPYVAGPDAPSGPPPGSGSQPVPPQPQWDDARKAYLSWDPARQQWLQWYDDSREWRPIDSARS